MRISFAHSGLPNNLGEKWLSIDATGTQEDRNFYITSGKDIYQPGSKLPYSTTEIAGWAVVWYLGFIPVNASYVFTRYEHPTFIPYTSALDLDGQGNFRFDVTFNSNERSFHDRVPDDIIQHVLSTLGIESEYYFAGNTTVSSNKTYTNKTIVIYDGVTVTFTGTVHLNNAEVQLGKDARIEVRNGGKLITDGATFKRLNASDQHGQLSPLTPNGSRDSTYN